MREYILKHSSAKQRELKYDFMPDLLEIIEKPCNKGSSLIIWLLFFMILTAILWAAFFKLDVVVTSSGVVEPAGGIRAIQSSVSGTVEHIAVREGDYVEKGQEILTLDQAINRTELDRAQYDRRLLQTQKSIFEKIHNGIRPEDIRAEDYGELQWAAQCVLQEEKIYQKDQEGLVLQADQSGNQSLSDLQMESYSMQRDLEILEKISSCDAKIRDYEAEIARYQYALENAVVKAPVSGCVTQLGVNAAGQSVPAAQTIAGIVPEAEELIFNCYLPDKDIADIKTGQKVNVKVKAYPYSDYGALEGTITYISPAAQAVENIGYVYTVRVTFKDTGAPVTLLPGMTGTVEISCGQRSVLDYFLEPVRKGIGSSLKEK